MVTETLELDFKFPLFFDVFLLLLRLSADLLSSLPLPEDFALETWSQLSHRALQAVLS